VSSADVERVVFLPGASGNPQFWTPVARHLSPSIECVRLGWPGLGREPARDDVRSFDDLVRLTVETIDRPVALVAQSMGGIVAVRAALAHPERVRRLVLVATSGGVNVARLGASDWRADYRREYPNAASFIFDVRVDLTDRIPSITAPTLLIWGDVDPISPVAVGKHLATLLPKAELVIIRGGDHALARDRADEVAPLIAHHLALR
jgi:pimeloyl-ACP methyl ester carboxylesterase